MNTYNYNHAKFDNASTLPVLGFNPDDGLFAGANYSRQHFGFLQNPFTANHAFGFNYFAATEGWAGNYSFEKARVFKRWNFGFDAEAQTENYAINFFGFGNESENPEADDEDNFNLDFNRVRQGKIAISPKMIRRGQLGSETIFHFNYEYFDIDNTAGRFINDFIQQNPIEQYYNFAGAGISYNYEIEDNAAFPVEAFRFFVASDYKYNLDNNDSFANAKGHLGMTYPLNKKRSLAIASTIGGHITFGDNYAFFQSAQIGADKGLRGYRNERFRGNNAMFHQTDLRWLIKSVETPILPSQIGLFTGFDYGRVWHPTSTSNNWKTSYGGGLFLDMAQTINLNISAFGSEEDILYSGGLGFAF